jgi:FtsZ-interacting cell division protein YlmF
MSRLTKLLYYMGIKDEGLDDLPLADAAPIGRTLRPGSFFRSSSTDEFPEAPRPPAESLPSPSAPRHSGVTVLDGRTPPRTLPTQSAAPRGVSPVRPTVQSKDDIVVLTAMSYTRDARRVADALKQRQILVVNLKAATPDERRRLIDFCAGVVYVIGGRMNKIDVDVVLVEPSPLRASPEALERVRFAKYRPSAE